MTDAPLTLTEAAAALRDGRTTSTQLVAEALRRADALDGRLGVYLARFDAYALERAAVADAELAAGVDRGPLHGIPIGVKDVLATAEGPTTAQSLVLDPAWGAGRDAVAVERLKAAGAVLTGKTTTTEFACGMPDAEKPFPLPRNPWDARAWAGGSSSGSGAGVAAGMFPAAVGTDTAGSIRLPAAFCGVTGLMPTFGRVPTAGLVPLGYSLDRVGPLARSARDCGLLLAVLAGPDPRDPYAVDAPVPDFLAQADGSLAGVRVGVARRAFGSELEDPAMRPAFEAALETLATLGAEPVELELPLYDEAVAAQWVTMTCEGLAYHRADLAARWDDYFAATRTTLALGATYSGADYVQAQRVRRVVQRELAAVFADVDLVATPTITTGAPTYEALETDGAGRLLATLQTQYWDAVGNPALALPIGFTDGGLPLSLQLAARPFEEALLVRAGDAYQQATDWHLRVPPLTVAA